MSTAHTTRRTTCTGCGTPMTLVREADGCWPPRICLDCRPAYDRLLAEAVCTTAWRATERTAAVAD